VSEHCLDCSEEYFDLGIYRVSDELWAQLAPEWSPHGLLCPKCLEKRAEARGVTLYWESSAGEFPTRVLKHAVSRMLRALDRIQRLRYWSDTETITWAISRSNWSVLVAARYRALVEELLGGKP
jgi:hypothetical protein